MILSFNCGNNNDNGAGGNPVSTNSNNSILDNDGKDCNGVAEIIQVINGVGSSLALQYFNGNVQFQFTTDSAYTGKPIVYINGYTECDICVSVSPTGQSFFHSGANYNFNQQLTGLQGNTTYTVTITIK